MMNEWGWISLAVLVVLLGVQTWYYVEKTWALHRTHERNVEDLEAEYAVQTTMMKKLTLPMVGVGEETP